MNDRKLLEMAAKAAGLRLVFPITKSGEDMPMVDANEDGLYRWNPLTDDGDALRLAVSLRLSVSQGASANPHKRQYVSVEGDRFAMQGVMRVVPDGPARLEITRRAITIAAACIGEAMP